MKYTIANYDSAADAVADMLSGTKLYIDMLGLERKEDSHFALLTRDSKLSDFEGEIYHRHSWQDEVGKYLKSCKHLNSATMIGFFAHGATHDVERPTDDEFVKLCHLVAEMTDKPE